MLNSRSISNELWAQARERLIFFFSRRLGTQNAEDLAHSTLLAIWGREDYRFAKEEDFLRVCYGFAKKILQEAYRNADNMGSAELDPDLMQKVLSVQGLKGPEATVFIEEVRRCGQQIWNMDEWNLIERAANREEDDAPASGKIRTRVHRLRKQLAKMTGWKKI